MDYFGGWNSLTTPEQMSTDLIRAKLENSNNRLRLSQLEQEALDAVHRSGMPKRRSKQVRDHFSTKRQHVENKQVLLVENSTYRYNKIKKELKIDENINGGGGISHEVRFNRIKDLVKSNLLLVDDDFLDVIFGAAATHKSKLTPIVWLWVTAPPGAGKSLLELLSAAPGVETMSELTTASFFSGFSEDKDDTEDHSFLEHHKDSLLVFKDLTTMLSLHRDKQVEIFGKFAEVYDGTYRKIYGNGKEANWDGHISIIAGVTPKIDRHYNLISSLGPRFLMFRPKLADEMALAQAARRQSKNWKKEAQFMVAEWMRSLPEELPPFDEDEFGDALDQLSVLVVAARSSVIRENFDGDIIEEVQKELPTRFSQEMWSFIRGVALIRGHKKVEFADMKTGVRLGLDSIPITRKRILLALMSGPRTMADIAAWPKFSVSGIEKHAEDLKYLGLTDYKEAKAYHWHLTELGQMVLGALKPFIEGPNQ